jgi:lipoprotein signal peptidase
LVDTINWIDSRDQASKFWVVHFFAEEGDTLPIIEGFFHFTYVRNPGAVFGLEEMWDSHSIFLSAWL